MNIISKQLACQKFIFKIHSSRLRKKKWCLSLPLDEARRNDEVISLADSQVLRWIDELNGVTDADENAKRIKSEIRFLKKEINSIINKRKIRQLYAELDTYQFKEDYLCLVIDKNSDYKRACKGFTVNGVKYVRLLGTNGGIKSSTIVFVSEKLSEELRRRIENDRNPNTKLVTAKLEAYKALTCSASIPVSLPNGILIVNDVETSFEDYVINLNDESGNEPIMSEPHKELITIDATDGFGIMLPSLAERWSSELQLGYVTSGVNTRFSFTKGMVFTFDFLDFAEKIAKKYIVKDAWGNDVDIRNIELILTTSMVKLWDSYESCADFIDKSIKNNYTFAITKTCPEHLETQRNLNYQFIQSYDLDDDDIYELVSPTLNEIKDILNSDWKKSILFLKGEGLNENNVLKLPDNYIKAIMIEPELLNDPFIQNDIYQLIKNRINQAKVGVIKVHGNFSIVSGDPYLLCQSVFGLEPTGLLKAGEIYNNYWGEAGSEKLACFRAPMTCHNNIRLVKVAYGEDVQYWYKHMQTCTILNAWDTAMNALNGCDFDGDLVMLTDNNVLVNKLKSLPSLMCAQRKADKRISTEEDFIRSNIESFGNDIGQTTNWITSMFEVQSHFDKDSPEYEVLDYRIRCGQLYQQNAIDKAKGIICKPMPQNWHDRRTVHKMDDGEQKDLYRAIVADKKPYFMRYIYPALSKQYTTYINNTNRNALREFQMTVSELQNIPQEELTDRQRDFLKYYDYNMPVGIGNCVVNKICRIFEDAFDGCNKRIDTSKDFDYSIMKSEDDYSIRQYQAIKRLYNEYNRRLKSYILSAEQERTDKSNTSSIISLMNSEFRKECDMVSPNSSVLCNIILDICYTKNATKKFAWNICGTEIIHNLLKRNGQISYPVASNEGDIEYAGKKFKISTTEAEVTE